MKHAVPGRPSSLDRILDIFLMFAESGSPLSVQAVAELFGSSRSSTYRYLQLLRTRGLIEEAGIPGYYRLGPTVIALARAGNDQRTLVTLAEPIMQDIAKASGESVMLTKRAGGKTVVLSSIDSPHMVRVNIAAAHNSPLNVGSFGKLQMAYLRGADLEHALKSPLAAKAPNTITDPETLRAELALIRQQGFALSDGEVETGMRSVSVPLCASAGTMVAALTLAGPAFRLTQPLLRKMVPQVVAAAAQIAEAWSAHVHSAELRAFTGDGPAPSSPVATASRGTP